MDIPSQPQSQALAIRRVPIDTLHLDPANARTHGEVNLEAIVASLQRFGQAEPIVVQKSTGRVIGGNGRLVAMRKLGWTDCDIVELDVGDLKATALGIALNRTAELAEWDLPTLGRLLDELKTEDAFDGIGFSTEELNAILDELPSDGTEDLDDPGPSEPPKDPVSRPGDLWILGDHRLLCGDSTNPDDISRLMAGDQAVLLSTDPPYCVNYDGSARPQDSGKDWSDTYREVDIKDLGEFLRSVFGAVLPHTRDDAAIYVWHAHLQYPVIHDVFGEFGILCHQPIVWVKPSSTLTFSFYRWAHEPCLFGWRKGNKPPHYLPNGVTSVWEADWEGKARVVGNEHPTQKPLRLFEIPMEMHTKPGAIVLEPFSGSGTQLLASQKLGRRCRAMEVSPAFVDVAVKRWQEATGKEATLDGSEKTFTEVSVERKGESHGEKTPA